MISFCPQCSADVKISSNPQIGTQVQCSGCGRTLEVVWLYPLQLDVAEIDIPVGESSLATPVVNQVES